MKQSKKATFERVILIVIDGVGAGELPDAAAYGDVGANTIGNCAQVLREKHNRLIRLPNMEALGYGNITDIDNVTPRHAGQGEGAFGKALEKSKGKDTTSGHWELAGLVVEKGFQTYPNGFPLDVVNRWVKENNLPGFLCNATASGTQVLDDLGPEHMRTGKPILYTSADSVWQVAAHEETFGLDRLYEICHSARKICDDLGVSRVIARPFVGDPSKGIPFKRTYNRKDYAQKPFGKTLLDVLVENEIKTLGIGKIQSIYAKQGIQESIETKGNAHGISVTIEQLKKFKRGLIFVNLIDFDMQYGHRRDVPGFADAMEEFDRAIPEIKAQMTKRDLLLITADHGNDPSFTGSDHTREYAPILAWSPVINSDGPIELGIRETFADTGATAAHALLGHPVNIEGIAGTSFLDRMLSG